MRLAAVFWATGGAGPVACNNEQDLVSKMNRCGLGAKCKLKARTGHTSFSDQPPGDVEGTESALGRLLKCR